MLTDQDASRVRVWPGGLSGAGSLSHQDCVSRRLSSLEFKTLFLSV